MKKIIAIILPFFVCCSFWFGGTVSAAKQAAVSVAEAAAGPGGIAEIDVKISDNPGITYLKLKINYDGSKLSLLSAENTGLLAGMMFTPSKTIEVNPYILQWASAAATNGGGTIAKLKFQVKDGAAAGDANLEITYTESYDEAIQVVNIIAQNGKIAIGGGGGAATSAPQPTAGANTPAPTGGESGQTSGGTATAGQNTGSTPGTDGTDPQPTGGGQTGGAQQADPTGSSRTDAPSGPSSSVSSKPGSTSDKNGPSKLWLLLLLLIPAAAAAVYIVYRRKKSAGSGRT